MRPPAASAESLSAWPCKISNLILVPSRWSALSWRISRSMRSRATLPASPAATDCCTVSSCSTSAATRVVLVELVDPRERLEQRLVVEHAHHDALRLGCEAGFVLANQLDVAVEVRVVVGLRQDALEIFRQ